MLRVMGFCGADDSVNQEILETISARYPWIEWGVLFRPDKEGEPRYYLLGAVDSVKYLKDIELGRYASWAWVERLAEVNAKAGSKMRLAAHLCGSRCDEVLRGDPKFVTQLQSLGFRRVQVVAAARRCPSTFRA